MTELEQKYLEYLQSEYAGNVDSDGFVKMKKIRQYENNTEQVDK